MLLLSFSFTGRKV